MEVSKAVHYLKCKELEKARETLRELEKREEKDQDPATRSRLQAARHASHVTRHTLHVTQLDTSQGCHQSRVYIVVVG